MRILPDKTFSYNLRIISVYPNIYRSSSYFADMLFSLKQGIASIRNMHPAGETLQSESFIQGITVPQLLNLATFKGLANTTHKHT